MRDALLFLHILAAILLLGPLMLSHIVMPTLLRKGRETVGVAKFFNLMASKLAPATLLILLLGVGLVEKLRSDDFDIGYGQTWIWLAIALLFAALINGAALIGPTEGKAIAAIEAGQPADKLITRVQILGLVNLGVMMVILWLMVDKPL